MTDSSTNQNTQPYQIRISNHHVGDVIDGKFKKRIKFSKHALRTPPALALSVESPNQAEQVGAREIEITDIESGRVYSCSIEYFKQYAFPVRRGGFEPQLALVLQRFDVTSPLEISSRALKPGEVKRNPGNGKRTRNPRGVRLVSPRQLLFKGMV
jgi:hypothetical protein